MEKAKPSTQNVRAVSRALAVLSSFAGKTSQSLAEVAAAAELDKGTARRLLLTLMKSDFVSQDTKTQQYQLGRAIRELAANVSDGLDIRTASFSVLSDLAAELHVTVFLSIYEEGNAICLERLHDMKGIEVHWWPVGGTLPLNCGGAPKLLLAFQSQEEIARVMQQPLVALTPKSTVDSAQLLRHLGDIRRRGWELAVDDVVVGLTALAVPLRDRRGTVVGAISLAGLTPQMVTRGRPAHLKPLRAAAEAISRKLSNAA